MELRQLLLALTVLIVTKLFTFVSPLPNGSSVEDSPGFANDQSTQLNTVAPEKLESSIPSHRFSPETSLQPEPLHSNSKQIYPDTSTTYQNERNPVQDWGSSPSPIDKTIQSPSSGMTLGSTKLTACETAKNAVVTVHAGREIGSGSIVSQEGLVITNFHVVRRLREQPLSVEIDGGIRVSGQVIARDRRNDLALIQLQANETLPVVRLAATDSSATVGQTVCAIGSPFGQAGKITQGTLVRVLGNGDLQSNVELQPGNSGGPLINEYGEMIGVNKGVARASNQGQRISYATSAIVAKRFIEENRFAAPVPNRFSDEWQVEPRYEKSGSHLAPPLN